MGGSVGPELEHGREAYARGAWRAARASFARADGVTPLGAADLERLATAAYMLGDDEGYVRCLERAHRAYLGAGEALRGARCAFWIVINLMVRGEAARATGWLARARRLIEGEEGDCVERGLLLLPRMFEQEAAGEREAAIATAAQAAAIGERLGDQDLFALASHDQGLLLIRSGRVREGLALLDEAMVAVTAGELSPIVNGFVYCGVILGCRTAYEPRRAQEWTAALARWCEQQPDMVSFTGTCRVHRAELLQLHGAWAEALEEARLAGERCEQARNESAASQAFYGQGEVHRLRGEWVAAEAAYREAHRRGREPQPGWALLRLAEGDGKAAGTTISRLLAETPDPAGRVALLPAQVEIMLAVGDVPAARRACDELAALIARWEGPMIAAVGAHARGAVALAEGDAHAALAAERAAWRRWAELSAPYPAARSRLLIGLALAALGDDDAAALELEAARAAFQALGAAPDVARVDALSSRPAPAAAHGLTTRELEVLRLVAVGRSNREIAAALVLSEHTVARHLQNIFAKLRVSSRTAAGAFAFEHGLVVRNDHDAPR